MASVPALPIAIFEQITVGAGVDQRVDVAGGIRDGKNNLRRHTIPA